jgi:hypothetical protein
MERSLGQVYGTTTQVSVNEIEMDPAFVNGIKDNEVSSCQNTSIDRSVDNIHFPLVLTIL